MAIQIVGEVATTSTEAATKGELDAGLAGKAALVHTHTLAQVVDLLSELALLVPATRTVAGYALSSNVTLVKGDVGLNNVDNTSDASKPISTLTQTALDLKAPLASPTFTGTPTLPTGTVATTQSPGDSTTKVATTAFVAALGALKAPLSQSINAQTGTTYTAVLGDAGNITTLSNASAITYTIPLNSSVAFPPGTSITLIALGAGQVTVSPTGGVTLVGRGSAFKSAGQYAIMVLLKIATDTWDLSGDVTT